MKTRKLIIILILAIFGSCTNLSGQRVVVLPEFGIKGGLNLSDLSVEDNTVMRAGFNAGLFLRMPVTGKLSFQPEVLYSTKGTDIIHNEEFLGIPIVEGETSINIHYIDVPLMIVFTLIEELKFQFGPYAGFLLDANFETQTEILDFIEIESEDDIDTDHFNTTDAGLAAGIEMNILNLSLGLRYNLGLIRVADEDMALDPILGDAGNRVMQIYIGLRF